MMISFYKADKSGRVWYYTVHDRQESLFGHYSLTVLWGRALLSGREKVYHYTSRKDLDKKLRDVFNNKISKGYKILYSFSRKKKYRRIFQDLEKEFVSNF